jgi:hypothetical protein
MKEINNWISNAKVRKRLYDFNQAVKTVYKAYSFVNGLAVPIMMDAIKNPNLFSKSIFIWFGDRWPFMERGAVDPEELNKALNNKGFKVSPDNHRELISEKDGTKYKVSINLTEQQIDDIAHYSGVKELHTIEQEDPVFLHVLSEEDIARIIAHESVETSIKSNDGNIVKFIMLKENFPLIKKASFISITGYQTKDPEIYKILITSKSKDIGSWEFDSIHYILNY